MKQKYLRDAPFVYECKIHAWTFLAAGPSPLDLVLKLLKMLHVKRLTQVRSMYLLSMHMAMCSSPC